jgi:hypothetical protein
VTKSDFIATVLENLGVLAAGQTVSAEDRDVIDRRMTSVFAQLSAEDLIDVADEENIDNAPALLLADIVTLACVTPYGITGPKLAELKVAEREARETIKLITREKPHRDTLVTPRFWGSRGGSYNGATDT